MKRGAENRTPSRIYPIVVKRLEVDLRTKQNAGRVEFSIINFVVDHVDRATERHAGAVGVCNTTAPTIGIHVFRTGDQAVFIVPIHVRCAQFVGTGRVVNAGNPRGGVAIVFKTVVVLLVGSADIEGGNSDVSADIPRITVIVHGRNGCLLLQVNRGVTAADGQTELVELTFVTSGEFPGGTVIVFNVIRCNASKAAGSVRTEVQNVRRIGQTSLEAAENRRQVGDLVVVACYVLGIVPLERKDSRAAEVERVISTVAAVAVGSDRVVDGVNVLTDTVDVAVGRGSSYLQEVSSTVFSTEVDAAPGALEVGVGLLNVKAVAGIGQLFRVETDRQAVVQRGFAREVNFSVTNDIKRAGFRVISGAVVIILVLPGDVTFHVATKTQLDAIGCLSGRGGKSQAESDGGCANKKFLHNSSSNFLVLSLLEYL